MANAKPIWQPLDLSKDTLKALKPEMEAMTAAQTTAREAKEAFDTALAAILAKSVSVPAGQTIKIGHSPWNDRLSFAFVAGAAEQKAAVRI